MMALPQNDDALLKLTVSGYLLGKDVKIDADKPMPFYYDGDERQLRWAEYDDVLIPAAATVGVGLFGLETMCGPEAERVPGGMKIIDTSVIARWLDFGVHASSDADPNYPLTDWDNVLVFKQGLAGYLYALDKFDARLFADLTGYGGVIGMQFHDDAPEELQLLAAAFCGRWCCPHYVVGDKGAAFGPERYYDFCSKLPEDVPRPMTPFEGIAAMIETRQARDARKH